MLIETLTSKVTGRSESLFKADVASHEGEISAAIKDCRILVIGGAGSIGSATVRQILNYGPRTLHVVDQNENGLAELVRWLRSNPGGLAVEDFRTLPLNFGSSIMRQFIQDQPPYDVVLNFAALKHVRSEKDPYSLLQMLDTNVVKTARMHRWLREREGLSCFFSVSTDKAANPVNAMGASKRLMEYVLFSDDFNAQNPFATTSARFANVAFSDGSLPMSFLSRYEKKQPLALPRATRRYFISMEEAGQICLVAAFCGFDKRVLVPNLDPTTDMCTMEDVANVVLSHYGMKPRYCEDEEEAKQRVAADVNEGYYPLLLTELNTSGEKPYEEFVGSDENEVDVGCKQLRGVTYQCAREGRMTELIDYLESANMADGQTVTKEGLINAVSDVLSEFCHMETGMNLDQRM